MLIVFKNTMNTRHNLIFKNIINRNVRKDSFQIRLRGNMEAILPLVLTEKKKNGPDGPGSTIMLAVTLTGSQMPWRIL